VYEEQSPYHLLRVTEKDGIRRLKFERNIQSSMRIADPFETDIEYVNCLHVTLAVRPEASRTLVIGLGGGSLVKRMWRDYPWMRIDAVEIDPAVVEVARVLFELPDDPRIRVLVGDGRRFVATTSDVYDIIVVDAFDDARVPRPLLTEEFMRACHGRLAPGGAIAYNVFGAVAGLYSKPLRSLYRTAKNVWRNVWLFPIGMGDTPTDQVRNIVIIASDAQLTDDQLLERIASRVDGMVTVQGFERFAEDLYGGPIRTGDAPILTDPRPDRWLR